MLILIVDDDALSRDLLTLLLGAEGHSVDVANSGEECLALLATSRSGGQAMPEVVLTDLRMPGISASPLAVALRPILPPHTLLIAMSGSQPAASASGSVPLGFDGFLLKPFQVSELEALIQDASGASPLASAMTYEERSCDEPPATSQPAADPDTRTAMSPADSPASNPDSEDAPDALDEGIYGKMCELMPAEQLGQMYALCVGDARKRIDKMSAFASAEDDASYRSEAHTVKGGCGMMGARELHELAAAAENNGLTSLQNSSGTTTVTATLKQLSAACDRLERILKVREDLRANQRV